MLDKLISNARRWIGFKEKGVQATGRPMTGGYESFNYTYWQQARDLPPFDFWAIHAMLRDSQVRLCLAIRSAPLFGVEWGWKERGQWQPGIKADRPEVAAFVERQMNKIWHNHLQEILKAQIWGWSAAEVCLRLGPTNLIEVNRLEFRRAEDTRLITRRGEPAGVEFRRVQGDDSGSVVNISFPEAFFHAYDKEPGQDYGNSALFGAFSPWCDKWLNGGALDVRRLFMHRDAYGSGDLGYPDGSTFIEGKEIPNRDIARKIMDDIRSGHSICRPSERDEKGNEKWPYQRAQVTANPQHILQYPKDLDDEIRQGMGIPDGVIDDAGTGAWGGKRIPMAAFYASLDSWVVTICNELTEQVLEPLVMWNFGQAHDFEIDHKPLAEQAMEQQSNAGGGMQPQQQQPGQPGGPNQQSDDDNDPFGAFIDEPDDGPQDGDTRPGKIGNTLEFKRSRWRDENKRITSMSLAKRAAELVNGATERVRLSLGDQTRAPEGGVTIDGTLYKGGEFVPGKTQQEVDDAAKSGSTKQEPAKANYNPQTQSEEFKNWFGDWENDPGGASKVVDAEGRPLAVYHGTSSPGFDSFSPEKIGSATDGGHLGRGFYFSTDSKITDGSQASIPVWLSIRRPLTISLPSFRDDKRDVVRQALGLPENASSEEVTRSAQDAGFDGVILDYGPAGYHHREIVAFDPAQIKSATGNRGTFDSESDNIRMSLARMSWERYEGDRGGSGWKNTATGEVRYQDDMPGESDTKDKDPESPSPGDIKADGNKTWRFNRNAKWELVDKDGWGHVADRTSFDSFVQEAKSWDTSKGNLESVVDLASGDFIRTAEKGVGLNFEGYASYINASTVRKVIKDHGNEKDPYLSVSMEDIENIGDALNFPDEIIPAGKDAETGLSAIEVRKRFNGRTVVIQLIHSKKRRLAVKTMFKQRSKK